jgi:hypothetical protein
MGDPVLSPVRETFRAIAATVVPEAASLDEYAWTELEQLIEYTLAPRPEAMRRQLRLFVRAIDLLPLARYGRRFRSLDLERRTRVLAALQRSPFLLLRRGFWGLRTLAFLGYYARTEARAEIGYDAGLRGWETHP